MMNVWAIPRLQGDKNGQKDHSKTPEYELGPVIIKCADTNIVTLRKLPLPIVRGQPCKHRRTYVTLPARMIMMRMCYIAKSRKTYGAYRLGYAPPPRYALQPAASFPVVTSFQSLPVLRPSLILRESPALHPSLR